MKGFFVEIMSFFIKDQLLKCKKKYMELRE